MARSSEDKLKEAVMSGNLKLARDAIAEGADVNVNYDKNSDNPHLDDLWRMVKIFEPVSILEIDCRPAKHNWGSTPLHHAVDGGHTELVELLIKSGADVNARDLQRETPLHIAAQNGNREIAELLIKSGADVNAQDNTGRTPLYIAVLKGYYDIAEFLIQRGADLNVKDNDGNTPLNVTKQEDHQKIIKMMLCCIDYLKKCDVDEPDTVDLSGHSESGGE